MHTVLKRDSLLEFLHSLGAILLLQPLAVHLTSTVEGGRWSGGIGEEFGPVCI